MNKKSIVLCEIFFAILLTLLFLTTAKAEVYKWKQGNVTQYSDIPPVTTTTYEQLKNKKIVNIAPQEVAPVEPPKSTPLVKNEMPVTGKPNAKKTPEQQEIDRKGREKSCATAKDNLQKLKNGGSVYKENTKGERTYLDETSIKNEMASAEKEIQATCQ